MLCQQDGETMQETVNNEKGITVLLCDDQMIVGEALRRLLADIPGLRFFHVDTPRKIIEAIEAFKPTVVLQDLVMPEISGIAVVKMIRADPAHRDLPVILLSTTDDAKVKYDAFAAGASDYVVKFPEKFEIVGRISYHSQAYLNLKAREQAQKQLEQKGRLESLGNLAAGIAHEINTPLQYISANLSYIQDSVRSLQLIEANPEVPIALRETIEGIEQISSIVRAMKAFAHPGKQEKVLSSINELVQDVRVLSKNEWRDHMEFELNLDESLAPVPCAPGGIAQVILNLTVNAAQAVKERVEREGIGGKISITTRRKGENIEIEVTDNGGGIPFDIQDRVFDPFFTTKEIGVGSGQGLALARTIVIAGHHGEIDFTSIPGEGTSFFVRLPFSPAAEKIEEQGGAHV